MTSLEEKLGYEFRDSELLRTALRHRSFSREGREQTADNERLEFLGDAVLGFLVSERLLQLFPDLAEGPLTKIKARLVSADGLFEVAAAIRLGDQVELGRTEEHNGGRSKKSILADAVEALIAAAYLDGGSAAAGSVVDRLILRPERVAEAKQNLAVDNAKSTLQEILQARQGPLPEYRVLSEEGPPHDRVFRVEVLVGEQVRVQGQGRTKKEAEQKAAREALRRIEPALG
ncbi:MAG: ribonuclease III [Acidobacteria bacterium]|nr:ribonuclease III [Acidobacteriota bacterium]